MGNYSQLLFQVKQSFLDIMKHKEIQEWQYDETQDIPSVHDSFRSVLDLLDACLPHRKRMFKRELFEWINTKIEEEDTNSEQRIRKWKTLQLCVLCAGVRHLKK